MTTTYEVKQATLDEVLWFTLKDIAYNAIVNEDYDIHVIFINNRIVRNIFKRTMRLLMKITTYT
jgi:hypothetical protein